MISNLHIFSLDTDVVIYSVPLFSFIKRKTDVVVSNMLIFPLAPYDVIFQCSSFLISKKEAIFLFINERRSTL